MNQNNLVDNNTHIHATGGGSYKYQSQMESIFAPKNISIHKYDEIASLVNGMQFVLHYAKNPSYTVVAGNTS